MNRTITSAALVLALISVASVASAVPPHQPALVAGGNLWTITFYDDSSPVHAQWATQRVCFFPAGVQGTHQRYAWVSISFPDWNGRATQEGDQVFMHGDFQFPFGNKDGGHDGMEWQLVTASPGGEFGATPRGEIGTGHWKEWVEDGRLGITIGFGNTLLRRVGRCPFRTAAEAMAANAQQALRDGQALAIAADDSGAGNPMGVPSSIYLKNAEDADKELEQPVSDTAAATTVPKQ